MEKFKTFRKEIQSDGAFRQQENQIATPFGDQEGLLSVIPGKVRYIEDVYKKADPGYDKRPTVLVVVDIEIGRGVNNGHINLTLHLETSWKRYHKEGAPDLFPEKNRRHSPDEYLN